MSAKPTHLLVIEDDPNLGYLLREYLQMNDFKVTLVTTVASALEKVQEDYFDLAVLDVMLPDGNGFDLAKAIVYSTNYDQFVFDMCHDHT